MYTISVEAGFCALHQVSYPDQTVEAPHGHDFLVRACFARQNLGDHGMVVDFARALAALRSVVESWHHTHLNEHEALAGLNPTAEVLARKVYDRLYALGLTTIRRVEVTEAPGCVAGYEPPVSRQPRKEIDAGQVDP